MQIVCQSISKRNQKMFHMFESMRSLCPKTGFCMVYAGNPEEGHTRKRLIRELLDIQAHQESCWNESREISGENNE